MSSSPKEQTMPDNGKFERVPGRKSIQMGPELDELASKFVANVKEGADLPDVIQNVVKVAEMGVMQEEDSPAGMGPMFVFNTQIDTSSIDFPYNLGSLDYGSKKDVVAPPSVAFAYFEILRRSLGGEEAYIGPPDPKREDKNPVYIQL